MEIQQATETQNSIGETIQGPWVTFAPWWASKLHLGANEGETDQQRYASALYEWRGNYIAGVTTKMRINEGGILFDIIDPDETRRRQGELRVTTRQRAV